MNQVTALEAARAFDKLMCRFPSNAMPPELVTLRQFIEQVSVLPAPTPSTPARQEARPN